MRSSLLIAKGCSGELKKFAELKKKYEKFQENLLPGNYLELKSVSFNKPHVVQKVTCHGMSSTTSHTRVGRAIISDSLRGPYFQIIPSSHFLLV